MNLATIIADQEGWSGPRTSLVRSRDHRHSQGAEGAIASSSKMPKTTFFNKNAPNFSFFLPRTLLGRLTATRPFRSQDCPPRGVAYHLQYKLLVTSMHVTQRHPGAYLGDLALRLHSNQSWRVAMSRSLPPLRSFARTVCPPLAAGPRSLIHPCHDKSGGPRW